MPKAKISAASPTADSRAVMLVKSITGLALSSAAKRLSEGKSGWLITADLFKGDHESRAAECERMISGLRALGHEPYVLYAPSSASWETVVENPTRYEMNPSILIRLLHEPVPDLD